MAGAPKKRPVNTPASGIPASGPGWGGSPRGAGSKAQTLTLFTAENQPAPEAKAAGVKAAIADRAEVLELYTSIMRTSEFEANKLSAGDKLLNRIEGTPIARNINVSADDPRVLSDEQLMRIASGDVPAETKH